MHTRNYQARGRAGLRVRAGFHSRCVAPALDAIEAAGADWYPLALARELDDAILSMRTNELDLGTWIIKTAGDAAAVLAMDATLMQDRDHWLVHETIGLLRRTLSRLDVSARSLFAQTFALNVRIAATIARKLSQAFASLPVRANACV